MTATCSNGRGIRRRELEERVLVGLKDHLMAPDVAAEAVRAWAEETNRLNRERRVSSVADRKELATLDKKIDQIVTAIHDTGFSRALTDRLHKFEARQEELQKRLATVPPDIPDVHPNIAGIDARKVARLAEALEKPDERDTAASAIQGLIERIVLTPDADGLHVTLKGDFRRDPQNGPEMGTGRE